MLRTNHELTGESAAHFVKRAAIMCDFLFMDPQGLGSPGDSQDRWIYDVLGEGESAFLRRSKAFKQLILRPQDIGDDRDVMAALWGNSFGENGDNLFPKALEVADRIAETGAFKGQRNPYKARGSLALELSHDMRMPVICQQWFESPVALLNPIHRQFLSLLRPISGDPDYLTSISELEAIGVVDFGQLSWERLIALRHSQFWRSFRMEIEKIGRGGDNLPAALWDELWRYAEETFPKLGKASVLGIIGSLPFPGSSIVGLTSSAIDAADAMRTRQDFGWLYFLLEAKRKIAR